MSFTVEQIRTIVAAGIRRGWLTMPPPAPPEPPKPPKPPKHAPTIIRGHFARKKPDHAVRREILTKIMETQDGPRPSPEIPANP